MIRPTKIAQQLTVSFDFKSTAGCEPYKLEFNDYRKWDTGDIPRSSMKVQLPKPPPMTVKHENYGLGKFVKTHPFGKLSFMKGPRSHQYTFREGGRELYFLDPHP